MANNSIKKMVELAVNITAKGFEKSGTTINGLATRLKTATKHALELSRALGMNGLGGTIRQLTGLTASLGGVFTLTSKEIRLLAKAFIDKTSSIRSVKQALDGAAGSVNDYRIRIDLLTEQINALNPADKRHNQLLAEKVRLQGLLNAELAKQNPQKGRSSSVLDADIQKEKELAAQRKASAKEQQALMKQSEASVIKQIEAKRKALAIEDELMRKSDLSVRKQISDAERKRSSAAIAEENRLMKESNADVKKQIALQKQQYSRSFVGRIETAVRWVGAYFLAGQAFLQVQRLLNFVFIDSIKAFITYEDSLKKLQAITGASVQEVNQLSEAAINLAKATVFTSTEIVELQKQLAKLGFSVSEIKDAQAAIAAFAQVTGVTIDQSAELVGKTIRAFNLSASSSQRIVNTFITGINKSALSGDYLATSMQYVASIGDQLNASVEMVTASLGILANAGFTASRAGTGLRLIFTEIGSAGEDLTETMRRLKEENISLSEAKELVGQRGAGALLTLINRYEEINGLVEESTDLTAKFIAEMTTLSSASNAIKQLGVVIQESSKNMGKIIYDFLALNQLTLIAVNNVERLGVLYGSLATIFPILNPNYWRSVEEKSVGMASSRLRLSQLISKANKEDAKELLDINRTEKERLQTLDWIIARQYASGEITDEEYEMLKKNKDIRENMLSIITDEVKIIENTALQEKTRADNYDRMKSDLNEMIRLSLTYEEIVKRTNNTFKTIQDELKLVESQIELNNGAIEMYQKMNDTNRVDYYTKENAILNGRKESLEAILKTYTDIEVLKAYEAAQMSQRADYEREILNRRKEILKLQKGGLTEEEKKRVELLDKEISYLEGRRDLLFGVIKEERKSDKEKIESFMQMYELQKKYLQQLEERKKYEAGQPTIEPFDLLGFDILEKKYKEEFENFKLFGDEYIASYQKFVSEILELEGDARDRKILEIQSKMQLDRIGKDMESGFDFLAGEIANGSITIEDAMKKANSEYNIAEFLIDGLDIDPADKERMKLVILEMYEKLFESIPKKENPIAKALGLNDKEFKEVVQAAKRMANEAVNAILDSANSRLDAEQRAVDARYSYEEKRYKSMLDANIINQQQYEKKIEKLEKERLNKTNEIEKKRFNNEKAQAIAQAAINTAVSLTRVLGSVPAMVLVSAMGAIQASIIAAQKFVPTKFEKGGLVEGPSHKDGGVPFMVRGRGMVELEGKEYIVNKEATRKYFPLLEQINSGVAQVSSRPTIERKTKYADGGFLGGDMTSILQSIDRKMSNPVRAYVSERELIGKMNERVDIKKRSAR